MVLFRVLRDEAAHATARIALEARVKFDVQIGAGKISDALENLSSTQGLFLFEVDLDSGLKRRQNYSHSQN